MRQYIDQIWAHKLKAIGSFGVLTLFHISESEKEKMRKDFFSGFLRNPFFVYPHLQTLEQACFEKKWKYKQLKKEIQEKEKNEAIVKAYVYVIELHSHVIDLILACKNNDMQAFDRENVFLYGDIQRDIFAFVLQNVRDLMETDYTSAPKDVKKSIQAWQDANIVCDASFSHISLPSEHVFQQCKKNLKHPFEDVFHDYEDKAVYAGKDIQKAFEHALRAIQANDWNIQLDTHPQTTVSQGKKTVYIPQHLELRGLALKSLILHEIGTHVLRRIQGEQSSFYLLASGMGHVREVEEGLATFQEQLLKQSKLTSFAKYGIYLGIGLALGVDGKKRDFREVYELLLHYFTWKNAHTQLRYEPNIMAWKTCVRIFRGTDGQTSGICFRKDMVYTQGNVKIWELAQKSPDTLSQLFIGKYNPFIAHHVQVLQALGILPL